MLWLKIPRRTQSWQVPFWTSKELQVQMKSKYSYLFNHCYVKHTRNLINKHKPKLSLHFSKEVNLWQLEWHKSKFHFKRAPQIELFINQFTTAYLHQVAKLSLAVVVVLYWFHNLCNRSQNGTGRDILGLGRCRNPDKWSHALYKGRIHRDVLRPVNHRYWVSWSRY